jgi:tetratricopeptide (TPR) repeat protein
MEAETISKNAARPKSRMGRGNFINLLSKGQCLSGLLTLVILFVNLCSCNAQSDAYYDEKLYRIEAMIFEEENFLEAQQSLDSIADRIQNHYQYYYYCAVISIELGNWQKAQDYLDKGLKKFPGHPYLLNEMGMLYGSRWASSRDENDLFTAIQYYQRTIDSKQSVSEDKARALRGIGFCLIELGELDKAEKNFNQSLLFEDSERAHNELKYIEMLREGNDSTSKLITSINKSSDAYEYISRQIETLPEELQETANQNRYVYIFVKALRFIETGAEAYREDDYFQYPLKEWDEQKLISGCNQIILNCRGLSPDMAFEFLSEDDFKHLFLMFHFEAKQIDQLPNGVIKGTFKHIMDKSECVCYCKTEL